MILSGQAITFLIAVGLGFALGIFYDIFRIITQSGLSKFFVAVCDIVFWITVTIAMFFAMLHVNFGEMRFFIFLGFAIGVCLHLCTLSRFVLRAGQTAKKGLHTAGKCVKIKGNKLAKEVKRYGSKIYPSKHKIAKKTD